MVKLVKGINELLINGLGEQKENIGDANSE